MNRPIHFLRLAHALGRDGNRYFGLLELRDPATE